MKSFVVVCVLLLAAADKGVAFTPVVSITSSSRAKSTSLAMSAALIVQNKGGGHGELGTFVLIRAVSVSCI
jgi:hypothetical protein